MLDEYQKRELKEFYSRDAGWSGVREMAKHLGVSKNTIRWYVNFNDYKKRQTKRLLRYRSLLKAKKIYGKD
jgi:hypothetical protein